jgi:hypothetical protein
MQPVENLEFTADVCERQSPCPCGWELARRQWVHAPR